MNVLNVIIPTTLPSHSGYVQLKKKSKNNKKEKKIYSYQCSSHDP